MAISLHNKILQLPSPMDIHELQRVRVLDLIHGRRFRKARRKVLRRSKRAMELDKLRARNHPATKTSEKADRLPEFVQQMPASSGTYRRNNTQNRDRILDRHTACTMLEYYASFGSSTTCLRGNLNLLTNRTRWVCI